MEGMVLTRGLPKKAGWYWCYDTYHNHLNIEYVRMYGDVLAIHNCPLKTSPHYKKCLWSESLPMPRGFEGCDEIIQKG